MIKVHSRRNWLIGIKFYQTVKKERILILEKFFWKTEKAEINLVILWGQNALLSKYNRDITRKLSTTAH